MSTAKKFLLIDKEREKKKKNSKNILLVKDNLPYTDFFLYMCIILRQILFLNIYYKNLSNYTE